MRWQSQEEGSHGFCFLLFSIFKGIKILKVKKNLASSQLKRALLIVQAKALLDGASVGEAEEALQIYKKVSFFFISGLLFIRIFHDFWFFSSIAYRL